VRDPGNGRLRWMATTELEPPGTSAAKEQMYHQWSFVSVAAVAVALAVNARNLDVLGRKYALLIAPGQGLPL